MIRFAPSVTVKPHCHIGHLFCYLATRDYAKSKGERFSVRLDLNPVKIKPIPIENITDTAELFPAEEISIHTNSILPVNVYREAYELCNLDMLTIIQMGKSKLEGNGDQLKMLTFYSVLWDRRSGVSEIVRDQTMKTAEEMESEFYEFMELPKPSYLYIPTLTYDGDKISGSWYGQCPVSCRLSTGKIDESRQLLDKVLDGKDPVDFIDSGIESIAVDDFVPREEPVMHGKAKMYPG